MKYVYSVLALLMLTGVNVAAEESNWYYLIGASVYSEDIDTAVGSGVAPRIAVGAKLSDRFGIELSFDRANPLDPEKAAEYLELTYYDITTTSNQYFSSLLTFMEKAREDVYFIGKVGFSHYRYDLEVNDLQGIDVQAKGSGTSPVASVGILYQAGETEGKNMIEVAFTHWSESDVKASALTASWRNKF